MVSVDPTANKLISFVEGFVDHARDYYTKRGVEPESDTEPAG